MRMENTEKQLARLEISRAKSLQQRPGLLIQKVACAPQNAPSLKYRHCRLSLGRNVVKLSS